MSEERSGRRRRRGHPVAAGAALQKLAKALGIEKTLDEYNVIEAWPAVVGERIAAVASAERIDNGVLFVKVSTAPWRAELSMQRQEILKKVNTLAGKTMVKEIRFR